MRLILACLLVLFCSVQTAEAGILNVFYTSPEVQVAHINYKAQKDTNRHNRKVQKQQNKHAAQSGIYNAAIPLYESRQLIQYRVQSQPQQYMQYRWSATVKRGSGCGCANGNCISNGDGTCSCK